MECVCALDVTAAGRPSTDANSGEAAERWACRTRSCSKHTIATISVNSCLPAREQPGSARIGKKVWVVRGRSKRLRTHRSAVCLLGWGLAMEQYH